MSKQFENLKDLGSSASLKPNYTQNIHTAFNTWMENHKEYVNLRFQYGDKLFMKQDGVFVIQVVRIAFEAFEHGIYPGSTTNNLRG